MIARLSGEVAAVGADHAVIDVGGVGYLVQASARTLSGLAVGGATVLAVETQVREDAITLFGFAGEAERAWFRLLTGVQGVGGRVALAILSVLTPDELARAVLLGDKAAPARAVGVGPKLAARIVLELKDKALPAGAGVGLAPAIASDVTSPGATPVARAASHDAQSALMNLGFRPPEAARAVAEAENELGEGAGVNDLIRVALRRAAR